MVNNSFLLIVFTSTISVLIYKCYSEDITYVSIKWQHVCQQLLLLLSQYNFDTGICRETCKASGTGETCSIIEDTICALDEDCAGTSFCYNSYCQEGCSREDKQCSTSGFTCQQDVCLKICDETGWF